MIVVIADDLSGAAELAGAAYRLGFTAEVQTRFSPDASSDVVCVDSEGRAMTASLAAEEMRRLFAAVAASAPDWIFLKFDSVLRGNIASQLGAALEAGGRETALLITANPSRGRTISGGNYLVDGVPLHRTPFADDPEFPCTTASVRELLGDASPGIVTPDIESTADLERWAKSADAGVLTAGSAEFFESLLRIRAGDPSGRTRVATDTPETPPPTAERRVPDGPSLLVCGSRASWRRRTDDARQRGIPIFDILDSPREAAVALTLDRSLLVGIGERIDGGSTTRSSLLDSLGAMVEMICGESRPARLLLEGGATANVVVRRMGWTRLICEDGLGQGVGTVRPAGSDSPLVLIKPGSYPWPAGAW